MDTPTTPEPTTFAELEAAGWKPIERHGTKWLEMRVGHFEVTVFLSGRVMASAPGWLRYPEEEACLLGARLAAALRDFKPTT